MNALRLAIEIAGRAIELLSLPMIHVDPDGVAVGAVDLCVDIDESLRVVIACRNAFETLDGVAKGCSIERRGLPRFQIRDIAAENQGRRAPRTSLEPRFRRIFLCKDQEHAACKGLAVYRSGK